MKLFYTGPVNNTEMLVVMLEKHGIPASQDFVDASAPDDGDLNRLARVLCRKRIMPAPASFSTRNVRMSFSRR